MARGVALCSPIQRRKVQNRHPFRTYVTGMFFASRTRGSGRGYLGLKLAFSAVGIGVFLLAVRLENRPLSWVGLGLLLISFLLRFLPRRSEG